MNLWSHTESYLLPKHLGGTDIEDPYPFQKGEITGCEKGVTVLNKVWNIAGKILDLKAWEWASLAECSILRAHQKEDVALPLGGSPTHRRGYPLNHLRSHFSFISCYLSVPFIQANSVSASTKFSKNLIGFPCNSQGPKSSDKKVPHISLLASAEMVNWIHEWYA